MNSEEFNEKHSALIKKYDVGCENNCDYWAMMTGCEYFAKETPESEFYDQFLFGLSGIHYNSSGIIAGDFDGYLELLEKYLVEKYADETT